MNPTHPHNQDQLLSLGPLKLRLQGPVQSSERFSEQKAHAAKKLQQLTDPKEAQQHWVWPALDASLQDEINLLKPRLDRASALVQIGMGGSSLGAKALVEMAQTMGKTCKPIYFLDTLDRQLFNDLLEQLDWRDPVFFVVSKSGTTLETLALMTLCLERLAQIKKAPVSDLLAEHVIFGTDPEIGPLRAMGARAKIPMLTIPPSVGGRYGLMTPAGFLAAEWAGLDLKQLRQGALSLLEPQALTQIQHWSHFLLDHYYLNHRTETVIMPYISGFKSFNSWFVQLWAESLGKDQQGLTPIAAQGPADQHSQLQLFLEGPPNKVTFFLTCADQPATTTTADRFNFGYARQLSQYYHQMLPEPGTPKDPWKPLSELDLDSVVKAQAQGTMLSFEEKNQPYIHLELPSLNEKSIGACFQAMMLLTSAVGYGLQIDPFGQPAVEAGKRHTLKILSSPPSAVK